MVIAYDRLLIFPKPAHDFHILCRKNRKRREYKIIPRCFWGIVCDADKDGSYERKEASL